MTAQEFRGLILSHEGAFEGSHHGHADFRVKKGIFASLSPDEESGVLRLPPAAAEVFGHTVVSQMGGMIWVRFTLAAVSAQELEPLVQTAWDSRK